MGPYWPPYSPPWRLEEQGELHTGPCHQHGPNTTSRQQTFPNHWNFVLASLSLLTTKRDLHHPEPPPQPTVQFPRMNLIWPPRHTTDTETSPDWDLEKSSTWPSQLLLKLVITCSVIPPPESSPGPGSECCLQHSTRIQRQDFFFCQVLFFI